jgi:transposase
MYSSTSKVRNQNALLARFGPPREFYYIAHTTTMERRQPLAPINPNRAYKKELSATQRCHISTYRTIGLSNEQIGARTFCTPATVATTFRRNPLRDDYKTLSRPGRPQALSRRDRRIILRIIRANPRVTYNVITLEASVTVSTSTLYRMLKEEGIMNWPKKGLH